LTETPTTLLRGEIWTVSGGGDYTGKPRPAVIIQASAFDATASVTICAFTTDATDAPLFRLAIEPDPTNNLRTASRLMVDKITTIPRSKLGTRQGALIPADLTRLNRAIMIVLGLA
jgi:mRNA interferase MazF